MTDATNGVVSAYPSGAAKITDSFSDVYVAPTLVFYVVFFFSLLLASWYFVL